MIIKIVNQLTSKSFGYDHLKNTNKYNNNDNDNKIYNYNSKFLLFYLH